MSYFEIELRALQHKAAKGDVTASRHLAKLWSDAGVGTAIARAACSLSLGLQLWISGRQRRRSSKQDFARGTLMTSLGEANSRTAALRLLSVVDAHFRRSR